MFPGWMEYNVRCAALEGPQFKNDNHDVWVLLCNAVRDGPGWAYTRRYKDSDESTGDARAAFLALYDQAFSQTNVAVILDKVRVGMHTSRYTGDSRTYDFEKHCRTWLNYQTTLVTHDKFPDEQDFTMNFIHTIHDKRLEYTKLQALDNPKYTDDFNECIGLFKKALGIRKMGAASTKRGRSLSSVRRGGNGGNGGGGSGNSANNSGSSSGTYSGTIEDKKYPSSVYKTFSNAQRQELYELRQKKRQRTIQSTTSTATNEPKGAGNSFGPKGRGKGKNKGQTPKNE